MEAQENWTLKLDEKLKKEKGDCEAFKDSMVHRTDHLVKELALKESSASSTVNRNPEKSCKECNKTFLMNFELEKHMVNAHAAKKNNSCDQCGKTFYLKWRLEKHFEVHNPGVKVCKYKQSGHDCPYEEVGCMFSHVTVTEEIVNITLEDVESDEAIEEDNLCYYCNTMFDNQNYLVLHMTEHHMDRFNAFQQDNSNNL